MLEKIKDFFRNIFKSNDTKYIEAPQEVNKIENEYNTQRNFEFKNQIVIPNEADNRALKLQRDYKAGLIEEEDLTEEEFDLLSSLYESQIKKTKQSIQKYKDRIISIKSQLA